MLSAVLSKLLNIFIKMIENIYKITSAITSIDNGILDLKPTRTSIIELEKIKVINLKSTPNR